MSKPGPESGGLLQDQPAREGQRQERGLSLCLSAQGFPNTLAASSVDFMVWMEELLRHFLDRQQNVKLCNKEDSFLPFFPFSHDLPVWLLKGISG